MENKRKKIGGEGLTMDDRPEKPPPLPSSLRGGAPQEDVARYLVFVLSLAGWVCWAPRPGTRTCPCVELGPIFFPPANVELTRMLKDYNGETFPWCSMFQWYFSKDWNF